MNTVRVHIHRDMYKLALDTDLGVIMFYHMHKLNFYSDFFLLGLG